MTIEPRCPDWLDDEARAEWVRTVPGLKDDQVDLDTLAAYCFVHSLWQRVAATLEAHAKDDVPGWTDADGGRRIHPALELRDQLGSTLYELAKAVGVTLDDERIRRPTRIIFVDEGPPE
jgi:phage terminase small subunit